MKRYERSPKLSGLVTVLCVLYGAAVILAAALVFYGADRHWLGTLLAYLPRYPFAFPAFVLIVAAAWMERYALAAGMAMLGLFAAGPYMGFSIPFPSSGPSASPDDRSLVVITHNMGEKGFDGDWLGGWVDAHDADILVFQECRPGVDERPQPEDWHYKSIESMCLVSKYPIKRAEARDRNDAYKKNGSAAIVLFELDVEGSSLWLLSLHLETVRDGLEAVMADRLGGTDELEYNIELRHWESEIAREWSKRAEGPLIVAGDFNLVDDSWIFRTYWGDFADAWQSCGLGYGHTKHTRVYDTRIDHVLLDESFACDAIEVGDSRGSDHSPLITRLRWIGG